MKVKLLFVLVGILVSSNSFALAGSDVVKLSSSGICHPPESPYYGRVNHQTKVSGITVGESLTLDECLKKGFRLPKALQAAWNAKKAGDVQGEIAALGESQKENDSVQNFSGLRFGLGVGISFLGEQIDKVEIIDSRIAITESRSNQARVILESHKFLWDGNMNKEKGQWGIGPFIAASLADNQGQGLLDAFGLGVMVGFRNGTSNTSWNIGAGWFVDTQIKELRPGLEDGMETTITDSALLTREIDKEGLMILISGSW